MGWLSRRVFLPIILIAVGSAVLSLAEIAFPRWVNPAGVALFYLALINICLQLGGWWAGAIATGLAFVALNWLFIEPRYTFAVNSEADVLLLAGFGATALINYFFIARLQRSNLETEVRERNVGRFYSFLMELLSANTAQDVARMLSQRLHSDLPAQAVQVTLDSGSVDQSEGNHAVLGAPTITEPILSARGRLGEVRIWRNHGAETVSSQMLRTYSSEAALVLERLRLTDTETRAQVLEQSDRLKGALLSSVSHELRTPLATITAGAESLSSGLVPIQSDEAREVLSDVNSAAKHLSQLVSNLLDMSRIESGALHPQFEWADLADIVNNALQHLRGELSQHELHLDLPPDLPLVAADPLQLDQVFTNLLINASKYAPPNTPICIEAHTRDANWILVTVGNESSQIPTIDLDRIFDKFQRVNHPERVLGTGLGLSICKGIIEAHGGQIWAENRPGFEHGMDFHFSLPRSWNGFFPGAPPLE